MPRGKGKRRTTKRVPGPAIADRIIALLQDTPGAKTSDLAERLGIGQLQIRNELMQLEARGEVSRTGQTRGTRWYLGSTPAATTAAAPTKQSRESSDEGRRGPKERVLDENRQMLGQLPDADVAERTGVSVRTIAAYRKKHGIPGYSGPRRRAGAEPVEVVSTVPVPKIAATRGASGAWRIEIRVRSENIVRYAFAVNLVDAARTAASGASSLGGEVVGIAWLGEAL